MTRGVLVALIAALVAISLFGESKQVADLKATVNAQQATIGELRTQLAHVRSVGTLAIQRGSALAAVAADQSGRSQQNSADALDALRATAKEVERHTRIIDEIQVSQIMTGRLMVLMACLMVALSVTIVLLFLSRRKTPNGAK